MNEQQEQDPWFMAVDMTKIEARVVAHMPQTKLEYSTFCPYCHYKKEHCCCDLEID